MNLSDILKEYDISNRKDFKEDDFHEALAQNIDRNILENQYEIIAFAFYEDLLKEINEGKAFYNYRFSINGNEYPSISMITPEMIKYWENRADEAKNPILKARYSGLVYEFKKEVTGEKPHHKYLSIWVSSLIEIVKGDYYQNAEFTLIKIFKALRLIKKFNISDKKDEIIDLLKSYFEKNKGHYPIVEFFADHVDELRKIGYTDGDIQSVFDQTENLFTEIISEENNSDYRSAQRLSVLLADYYISKNNREKANAIVLDSGKVFQRKINASKPFQQSFFYNDLIKHYTKYSLNNEIEHLLIKIRELGPSVYSTMGSFPVKYSIDAEFIELAKGLSITDSVQTTFENIAKIFLFSKEIFEKELSTSLTESSLQSLFNTQLLDKNGRVKATIGPSSSDENGHLISSYTRIISLSAPILNIVLYTAFDKHDIKPSQVISFINRDNVFDDDKIEILEQALEAYFASNYIIFLHLIIPQIENAFRNLVKNKGGNTYTPSKSGGHNLIILDKLLDSDELKDIFGEEKILYFKILLSDQRGYNLRNEISHGLMTSGSFSIVPSDRIFHLLLLFGTI